MFETALISGDNLGAMWAVCFSIAALAFYLEQKTKWASKLGSALIAILVALILANVGIIEFPRLFCYQRLPSASGDPSAAV